MASKQFQVRGSTCSRRRLLALPALARARHCAVCDSMLCLGRRSAPPGRCSNHEAEFANCQTCTKWQFRHRKCVRNSMQLPSLGLPSLFVDCLSKLNAKEGSGTECDTLNAKLEEHCVQELQFWKFEFLLRLKSSFAFRNRLCYRNRV